MTLLFYTAADRSYEHFVPLYIYFALRNNPTASVEIALESSDDYISRNPHQIRVLEDMFPNQFKLSTKDMTEISPASVRFLSEPEMYPDHDYVYIGDIDILILSGDIKQKHIRNMEINNADFSNVIRKTKKNRLTGLHFAPTDLYYPLDNIEEEVIIARHHERAADEHALYQLMERKSSMISEDMKYRPTHGIHIRTNNHPFGVNKGLKGPRIDYTGIRDEKTNNPWTGIEKEEYREAFINQSNEPGFQELYFHLHWKAKHLLFILEQLSEGRFLEYEDEIMKHVVSRYFNTYLLKRKMNQTILGDIYNQYFN